MGEVVNLRIARKRRRREDEARQADENRVRHGLTKAEKTVARSERRRSVDALDGHRLAKGDKDDA